MIPLIFSSKGDSQGLNLNFATLESDFGYLQDHKLADMLTQGEKLDMFFDV